jgi:hypothetical protein
MQLTQQTLLLFTLNFLDAVFTIYWVHFGFATEGNQLMAGLLDIGYAPFLMVKIAVGALAAVVLWHWRNLRLAKYGLALALTVYVGLMGVHFITGLSAAGFISETMIVDLTVWSRDVFGFIL